MTYGPWVLIIIVNIRDGHFPSFNFVILFIKDGGCQTHDALDDCGDLEKVMTMTFTACGDQCLR